MEENCSNQLNELLKRSLTVTIKFNGGFVDEIDEKLSLELLEELQASLKVHERERQLIVAE